MEPQHGNNMAAHAPQKHLVPDLVDCPNPGCTYRGRACNMAQHAQTHMPRTASLACPPRHALPQQAPAPPPLLPCPYSCCVFKTGSLHLLREHVGGHTRAVAAWLESAKGRELMACMERA
jgi:hypothetical protein